MKKNIKNIILVVTVLVLFIWGIRAAFFKEKATETEPQKKSQETTFETIKSIATPSKASPKSILYALQKSLVFNKRMPVYRINNQKIDNIGADKMAKSFGFNNKPDVNEENFMVYTSQENNTRLDIDRQIGTVSFAKNLLLNPMIKPIQTISTEEMVNKLKELMVNNFSLDKEVKIRVESIGYEELVGPRFVESTKEKGNIVKIVANYEVFGLPVYSSNGFPVIARFASDGNLLNLSADLPFNSVVKQADFLVKTEEELRAAPVEDYKIINLDGGRNYDLASTEEAVSGVNITSGFPGYAYTPENNYLAPFVFFKGDSKLQAGAVTVILAVPALKEKEYYK